MTTTPPALAINNLRKRYGDVEAVKGVSFTIDKGDFFGFIGPNGAGKTTTIKSIVGLLNFTGTIKVFGHDVITDYREARRRIGLSPQEFNFDRFLTVEEELSYTAGYYGIPRREAQRRITQLLKRFKLTDKRTKRTENLSGGMKRRAIIARALIHEPDILILDEPTAGLDVELRRELWTELSRINKAGTTIILTTHYIEEVEMLCNKVGIINKGKLIAFDEKERIMEELGNETLVLHTAKPIPKRILDGVDAYIEVEGKRTRFTGKGMKQKAKALILRVEKSTPIEEIDMQRESLENIFVRMTTEGTAHPEGKS
ncbi:ABC transporter ATP-binding protein [Candidatus Woesearchaeota archaeon]|nr:MAG: ABC transporter ATP-binding protein [Candidatus Woesearchaeota archaeon]